MGSSLPRHGVAYGERNLARNLEENDKKIVVEPCRVGEREKVLKK